MYVFVCEYKYVFDFIFSLFKSIIIPRFESCLNPLKFVFRYF